MKSKGIRVLDEEGGVVCVELPDILGEIKDGEEFNWSILYVYVVGDLGEGILLSEFEQSVNQSERGLFISWDELNKVSLKFFDIYDVIILGCRNAELLRRYKRDQEKYETCDICIEMFDSCFWEVFSKDKSLIDRLAKKLDRKSTRLNSSHSQQSRMPSSA